MEIIEDGNLVDRVRILLQRDMQYYQEMQTVLLEAVCMRVSGGKLDFPRLASFAAIKMVTWWEVEFFAAFRIPSGLSMTDDNENRRKGAEEDGVIKKTPPSEFILLIIDTSEQLLEHLHTLIQESLDHADLTVLTATLGAAALVRNCLWCYDQRSKTKIPVQLSTRLFVCYQSYNEMAEAVAERLLDLHCRLISLYILNEADSLSWQKKNYFFEKERCSFTTQMWWLYMQGSKADLWNTLPPKMAQRVFAGMLNESLSIIVTRFIHGRPSLARSEQFWADAFNVLCCSARLTLSASVDSDELLGLRAHKLSMGMRDIHAKCTELFACFLLRGIPLRVLYQACRNGLDGMMLLDQYGPAPWLLICAPNLLGNSISRHKWWTKPLSVRAQLIIELNVLKTQPYPSWTQLLKVFSMDECTVGRMLMSKLVRQCVGFTETTSSSSRVDEPSVSGTVDGCGGFLCPGSACDRLASDKDCGHSPSLCLYSIAYISANTFMDPLFATVPALKKDTDWSNYLDKQQIWNQARPPWLNAFLAALRPIVVPIVETLLDAVEMGASIYQAMSLLLACLMELYVCAPVRIFTTCFAVNENLPAHCHPLGGSVVLHILCASVYSALLRLSVDDETGERSTEVQVHETKNTTKFAVDTDGDNAQDIAAASATTLAEALCSIDKDNKHTDEMRALLTLIQEWYWQPWIDLQHNKTDRNAEVYKIPAYIETYSDQLLFNRVGRRCLKVAHEYLIKKSDWVLKNLEQRDTNVQDDVSDAKEISVNAKPPLTYMMFHINDTSFDQFLIDFNYSYWESVLKTPISGTVERVRSQILVRPEFKNFEDITPEEKDVIRSMKELCSADLPVNFP